MHGKNRFKLFGRHTEERKKHPVTDRESAVSAAARWGMSKRRVLQLCAAGKVYAAKKDASGRWTIPVNAIKPVDGRRYLGVSIPRQLIMAIEKADTTVAAYRPLAWRNCVEAHIRGIEQWNRRVRISAFRRRP